MQLVAWFALFASLSGAPQAGKPVCNAGNRGQYWPREANISKSAVRTFYQRGDLEICALGVWRYRWEHLSVNVRDLVKRDRVVKSESHEADAKEE